MTSVEVFPGGSPFELESAVSVRPYGMISPENLQGHELEQGFEQVFNALQEFPPSEVALRGKLYAVVNHEEVNVTSILTTQGGPIRSTEGNVRIIRLRAISLIKGFDGNIYGEGHNSKEIVRRGSNLVQIAEDESSVKPLTDFEKDLFVQICSILQNRSPR